MSDEVNSAVEKLQENIRKAVADCARSEDLEKIVKQVDDLQGRFAEAVKGMESEEDRARLYSEFSEITEKIGKLSEVKFDDFMDRDSVMEVVRHMIQDMKESGEDALTECQVKDRSTAWEEKDGGRYKYSCSFDLDCRFDPVTRYTNLKSVPAAEYIRGVTANVAVPGAATQRGFPINELRAGNPFAMDIFMHPVGANDSFQPIDMTTMNFAKATSVTLTGTDTRNAGGAASRQVQLEAWELKSIWSKLGMDDVPAYRMAVEDGIVMADAQAKGAEIFSVAKASVGKVNSAITGATAGTKAQFDAGKQFRRVLAGVASNGLPTAANILGKLEEMEAMIEPHYRVGAKYYLGPAVISLLRQGARTNSPFDFSPELGIMTVYGYPIVQTAHVEGGGTAGNVAALFGNMRRGMAFGERMMIEVSAYEETNPGAITFYACSKFAPAITDFRAMVGLYAGNANPS